MQPDSANPDDDIDRKSLRLLRDRFLALNQQRLEALRSRLPEERLAFVDAVPLLLHSNHAALPGFVDFEMPCGIERYAPDRRALNAVRKIALSFVLERFVERRTQIQALYATPLPGEGLELCVVSALATHAALNEKLARLVRYARDHGVALTTSLIDPAEEHARRSRQRTPSLARDAFYRSAILLAGRYPIWWLVPPQLDHAHDAYCARLKSQRFIGRDETFDLGRADPVPAGECLSAGIELLDAALAAPYTHLPSLMLLESYAVGATVEPLAHFYKERIWRGDAAVDSSTLLDEAIAAYCTERDDLERLALVRDCRRGALREPTLAELQRENARVNAELQCAHRNLTRLASEQRASNDVLIRLHAIGERIAQWTERRDQAIPRINPALWPTRVAGYVRVDTQGDQWRLQDGDTAVFAAPRFTATIAWAHTHRLSIENLRVTDAHRHACARMIELLTRYDGGTPAQPATLLIVNAQESPQFALRGPGEAIISDWDDPLDFSGFHTSLIAGVDLLDVRHDGIAATGRAGDDGLIDALIGLLSTPAANLHVQCVGGEYERAIEARVAELASQMSAAFHRDASGRFVFALAGGFVVIERNAARFAAHRCANDLQLFEALATPRRRGLRVDARNIRLSGLSHLCGVAASAQDTVLIHEQRGTVAVLLALRDGTIHRFPTQPRPVNEIAADLDEFVAREAGNHVIAIYVAQANAAPRRVASTASKRTSARAASPRNLLTLLREKFAAEMEPARHPTVA